MFFLASNEVSFPMTFPVLFSSGVSMNEAVRQPIELYYPPKHRFYLPYVFMQTSIPVWAADGEAVQGGTDIELVETGQSQVQIVAPVSPT